MSCTRFHLTFWTSDQFFVIILVKISIFSCKKCAYLEIQLWVLLKFWLSAGKKKKKKNFGADRDLNRDRQIGNQVYIPRDHRASYKFMWFHYYIYHRVDEIRRKKYLASTRIWTRDSWLTTRYSYPETRGVVIEYSLEFNIWIISSAIASF